MDDKAAVCLILGLGILGALTFIWIMNNVVSILG